MKHPLFISYSGNSEGKKDGEIVKIVRRERNLLEILMIIWEDSVRHTHDFLRERDIGSDCVRWYTRIWNLFLNYGLLRLTGSRYKGFMGH